MIKNVFILLFFCISFHLSAQTDSVSHVKYNDTSVINTTRLIVVATTVPATITGVAVYLNKAWWSDKRIPFHFTDTLDWKYALQLDKAGHFWASKLTADVMGSLLHWTGFPKKKALWMGVGSAVLLSTIVEFKDAYSPWWGFSVSDMAANVLGAFYPLLQESYPVMQNFNFKWSYDFCKSSYYSTTQYHENPNFLDDYERHTYWLTVDVVNLFYSQKPKYMPGFLNVAVGTSAEWLDGRGNGKRELFFALDLNLLRLPVFQKPYLRTVAHYVGYYHLPAPAIKVKPYQVWYGLTF